ncbi:MAG: dCTP deaminase [Promethearchaeati archaeon SRVP18_Atabeyarchaeia-1]
MILSDRDIKKLLKTNELLIEPLDPATQIQPSSVDLRLGNLFRVFKPSEKAYIDPLNDKDLEKYTEVIKVEDGKPFILHPYEFVLATTVERVKLPNNLVGRLEGRSSLGRIAVVIHATAGFVDSCFDGHLTLEMSNVGKLPVALYPGQRVCQIVFEMLSSPSERPYGHPDRGSKYQHQVGPEPSKIYRDEELRCRREPLEGQNS